MLEPGDDMQEVRRSIVLLKSGNADGRKGSGQTCLCRGNIKTVTERRC